MDLAQTIEAYHQALSEVVKGDPRPLKRLYSQRDDVTVANPWGPSRRGWSQVADAIERAASQFRDGHSQERPHERLAEFVGADLAYLVENERWEAKISGREELSPFELRVTTIFRLEGSDWRVVHRHADTITTPNPVGPLRRP